MTTVKVAALSGGAVAEADPICRARRQAHRQQSVRERDPTLRPRPAQLALRRYGGRGQRQCKPVFADRDLQGQRGRSVSLFGRFVQSLAFGKDGERLRAALAVAPFLGRLSFS